MLFSTLKVDYIWNDLAGEVSEMNGSQTLPSRARVPANDHHRCDRSLDFYYRTLWVFGRHDM